MSADIGELLAQDISARIVAVAEMNCTETDSLARALQRMAIIEQICEMDQAAMLNVLGLSYVFQSAAGGNCKPPL